MRRGLATIAIIFATLGAGTAFAEKGRQTGFRDVEQVILLLKQK